MRLKSSSGSPSSDPGPYSGIVSVASAVRRVGTIASRATSVIRRQYLPGSYQRLVPGLPPRTPPPPGVEIPGPQIVAEPRKRQAAVPFRAAPLLRRGEQRPADAPPLRFARDGEDRDVTVRLAGEVVAPGLEEQNAGEAQLFVLGDEQRRAGGRSRQRVGECSALPFGDLRRRTRGRAEAGQAIRQRKNGLSIGLYRGPNRKGEHRWLPGPRRAGHVFVLRFPPRWGGADAACQAKVRASRIGPVRAARSLTFVQPACPQAPLTGWYTSGWDRTRKLWSSGESLIMAYPLSGYPSVAKIFPRTRKSGWPMCWASDASGRLSASRRNWSGVTPILSRPPRQVPSPATPWPHPRDGRGGCPGFSRSPAGFRRWMET